MGLEKGEGERAKETYQTTFDTLPAPSLLSDLHLPPVCTTV